MGTRNRRLLTANRALLCDILHYARKMPVARAEMSMDLSSVAMHRSVAKPRISWAAIFLKAYGIVSDRYEWLRTSYMSYPLPHVYQHPLSVGTLAIHRELAGQSRLCWGRLIDPGNCTLPEIQWRLNQYTQNPAAQVFRKQLQLSRLPWPLRRIVWWVILNVSGRVRERQLGTFSMSSLAGQGVINREHPTICTTSLTYGPIGRDGHALITLVYDHRLFDGMQAAQALHQLRGCLQQDLVAELDQISHRLAA